MDSQAELLRCPCRFCGELIAVDARKCRYCNEWLTALPRIFRWTGLGLAVLSTVAAAVLGFSIRSFDPAAPPKDSVAEPTLIPTLRPNKPAELPAPTEDTVVVGETVVSRHQRAEKLRLKGMALYSQGEALFKQTGGLAERNDRFWQALAKFREASSLNRNNPEPLFNMAVVLEAMNEREAARGYFEQALSRAQDEKWLVIRLKSKQSLERIKLHSTSSVSF